jgi:tetratricopeptide (TPR) repeat protein
VGAIDDHNQAIQVNPKYADVYNNRGLAYHVLKQYKKALADLNQAIELGLKEAIPDRDTVLQQLQLPEHPKFWQLNSLKSQI